MRELPRLWMIGRVFGNASTSSQSLFKPSRLAEISRLAERSPEQAANLPELAVVKTGNFAKAGATKGDKARVVVWNLERGRDLGRWMTIDAIRRADVLVLCEVDDGMARSGNLNVAEELAQRLGMHYAFAPSYFEFTRGTRRERRATRGLVNAIGFHGNAILSRWPLSGSRRVSLPLTFDWFRHYEKRIGSRVGLIAETEAPAGPMSLVAVHLEAFTTPERRAEQLRVLLRAIPESPRRAIIAGDFNTFGVRPSWLGGLRALGEQLYDPSRRTMGVISFEPLFEEAARAGFSWQNANVNVPTWRFPPFAPAFHAKLDWALVRGLAVDPESVSVVAAIGKGAAKRTRLSDHDGLTLAVRSQESATHTR